MKDLMNLNSLHLNYLTPLLKWRVMDLESLRQECTNAPKYKNFYRIINLLERKKILDGYRDPYSRKKYIYLSSLGENRLSLKENPTAISKDTLIHDIKVTEISYELLSQGWIDEAILEHQIHDKRNFRTTYKIIPDAVLNFKKNDFKYQIAFELELSRKNNQRIIEKVNQYATSDFYHYVIYFFPTLNLLKKYQSLIKEEANPLAFEKFFFFYNENLSSLSRNFEAVKGFYKDEEIHFGKLFGH